MPRHVGVVQHARVLEADARLQDGGGGALRPLRGGFARQGRRASPGQAQASPRHQSRPQEAQQDGPRLSR